MTGRSFQDLVFQSWQSKHYICVGLDSDVTKIPKTETQFSFNKKMIEATHDLVAAYKPNTAFYESEGSLGWETLKQTIALIHEIAPQALVILDAKRGDIGNTNLGYVQAAFEDLQADAITLHPYMGAESLQPFLDCKDKGCFILCRTSNSGSGEFQELSVNGTPLYLKIAEQVAKRWNKNKNCGLVVGATYPEELKKVREVASDLPFLVPGVGSQGGDLNTVLANGARVDGSGLIVNLSRSVLFASSGANFATAAREELLKSNCHPEL